MYESVGENSPVLCPVLKMNYPGVNKGDKRERDKFFEVNGIAGNAVSK